MVQMGDYSVCRNISGPCRDKHHSPPTSRLVSKMKVLLPNTRSHYSPVLIDDYSRLVAKTATAYAHAGKAGIFDVGSVYDRLLVSDLQPNAVWRYKNAADHNGTWIC